MCPLFTAPILSSSEPVILNLNFSGLSESDLARLEAESLLILSCYYSANVFIERPMVGRALQPRVSMGVTRCFSPLAVTPDAAFARVCLWLR